MTRIAGTVTVTTRITAATAGSGYRPGAKILQFRNLPQKFGSLLF
jgi:hypothetical protein